MTNTKPNSVTTQNDSFSRNVNQPAAIVLCKSLTGLSTVRALARAGIEVHAFIFSSESAARFSRYGIKVVLPNIAEDDTALIQNLIKYAKSFPERPVVMPSCDQHALWLSEHAVELRETCRIWQTPYDVLHNIIGKDGLYQFAHAANIPTIASIIAPSVTEADEWSRLHAAPYLLKPYFVGTKQCRFPDKNMRIDTRDHLLNYIEEFGATGVVVQQLLRGGDGHILDCYGLRDAKGEIKALVSHRRIRQHQPNFGATCFGEIPAAIPAVLERAIFAQSRRLLEATNYHGIFGIEWLHDIDTNNGYLIDFNARPFLTIGHVEHCGINLPALAYADLAECSPPAGMRVSLSRSSTWIDLLRDLETFFAKRRAAGETRQESMISWLKSVLSTRSYAYWDWRDPVPGIVRGLELTKRVLAFLLKKFATQKTRAAH